MKYIKVFENFFDITQKKINKKELKEDFFIAYPKNTVLYFMDSETNLFEIKLKDIEFTNLSTFLVFKAENGSKILIDSIKIEDKYLNEISILDCELTKDSYDLLLDMLELLNSYLEK